MIQTLRTYLTGFWFSLPVQLLLLHFKKYQVLLVFWYVLFATINGSFMHRFGAHMLFLYPEYLGKVDLLSTLLVGAGYAIFVLCWNITTFILCSNQFRFLAATTQPFLKYTINNGIIPLAFLLFYLVRAVQFARMQELLPWQSILALCGGFLLGFAFIMAVGLLYFFGADRTIYKRMSVQTKKTLAAKHQPLPNRKRRNGSFIRIDWYLSASLRLRQPRNVSHYTHEFLERIFSQHHLSSIFSVLLVFGLLIVAGLWQDNALMQLPSAGSIMVFFAILIAVAGGISYFLGQWSLLVAALFLWGLNVLYQKNILDPRNKAYGLQYEGVTKPLYTSAALVASAGPKNLALDSAHYIALLNTWKSKQATPKPTLVLMAVSGGGTRAAMFTTHALRYLDSSTNGHLQGATFLISGASGGMLGAAWFRELKWRYQQAGKQPPIPKTLTDAIGKDLLNPLFSSFVTRDLLKPAQFFTYQHKRYIKDRGFAFEQKLNSNTFGWLNKPLKAYAQAESSAQIPLLLASAVITRDGRKIIFTNHPARFLTASPQMGLQKAPYPDGIDFKSFFKEQNADQIRFLSVLRMNATFPYVLPNVWLPTQPVVDVMDAGFRDNTGLEICIRFAWYFKKWIAENCSHVLIVQTRDKPEGGWENPYESDNIFDLVAKPALLTQNNLFQFQEYEQLRKLTMLEEGLRPLFKRVVLEYTPTKKQAGASLSFHLTKSEQVDIENALLLPQNQHSFHEIKKLLPPAALGNQ